MFKFIKNLLGIGAQESVKDIVIPQAPYKVETPNEVVITRALAPASNPDVIVTPGTAKRAKDARGKFKADDPTTPDVNEAWKGGRAPAKKSKPKANSSKPKTSAKPKSKK